MAGGKIPVGAIMHQQRIVLLGDRHEGFDFLARVADAKGIVRVDDVDHRGAVIDRLFKRFGRQLVIGCGIVDRNLDHLRALLTGKKAGPFPGRIGGDQRRSGTAARTADRRQRVDATFGHNGFDAGHAEIIDNGLPKRLETERWCIGVELQGFDGIEHRLLYCWMGRDVVGVLAHPQKTFSGEKLVEILVTRVEAHGVCFQENRSDDRAARGNAAVDGDDGAGDVASPR